MKNWTVITSLRQATDVGLPYAEKALAGEHAEFVERVAFDPEYKKIFVNIDGSDTPLSEKAQDLIRTAMTQGAITNARAAVDAASLVFAQSILDDCAWSYCKVCALASPDDWDPLIREKKIDFGALREKNLDTIREELIQAKLNQLERKSLLTKVDLLFPLCPPPKDFAPIENYAFDRDRLERIDGDRHRIIHSNGFGEVLTNVEEDLEFVSKTANYLMGLVNQKYGIQLHPLKMFGLPAVPAMAAHAPCRKG
jgi:hypothetical protein